MQSADLIKNETDIETAEGVRLPLVPAGVAVRGLAFALDLLFQGVLLFAVGIASAAAGLAGGGIFLLILFLTWWFYGVFFDMLLNGQTLGKKIVGIRTIRDNGSPITLDASIVRNLLLAADFLPFLWIGGLFSMVLTKNSRRLGDLVAGTIVIYQQKVVRTELTNSQQAAQLDLPLTASDQQALLSFAERFEQISPGRQAELANILAPHIQNPSGEPAQQLRDLGARIGGKS
ncbi:RDD family protein [Salinibius halmophilus]|uniref:RDD family protein n=1 Tax=Salinibius halmophilus TaxID=1853216 RepID=UPI000E66F6B4|nr:RDD family protein [Salinibius halmophilus]